MKKILKTLKLKWAEYLLEMVVIIFGILCAFGLNNWNESRKERIKQVELLIELKENLIEDINVFKTYIDVQEDFIERITRAMSLLESDVVDEDSLSYYLKGISHFEDYQINSAAFETLKNSGFERIKSKKLKKSLARYYDVLTKQLRFIVERLNTEQRDALEQYRWKERQIYKGETENFKFYIRTKDRFYINYLHARMDWKKDYVNDMCMTTLASTTQLVSDIEKELIKLK